MIAFDRYRERPCRVGPAHGTHHHDRRCCKTHTYATSLIRTCGFVPCPRLLDACLLLLACLQVNPELLSGLIAICGQPRILEHMKIKREQSVPPPPPHVRPAEADRPCTVLPGVTKQDLQRGPLSKAMALVDVSGGVVPLGPELRAALGGVLGLNNRCAASAAWKPAGAHRVLPLQ